MGSNSLGIDQSEPRWPPGRVRSRVSRFLVEILPPRPYRPAPAGRNRAARWAGVRLKDAEHPPLIARKTTQKP